MNEIDEEVKEFLDSTYEEGWFEIFDKFRETWPEEFEDELNELDAICDKITKHLKKFEKKVKYKYEGRYAAFLS